MAITKRETGLHFCLPAVCVRRCFPFSHRLYFMLPTPIWSKSNPSFPFYEPNKAAGLGLPRTARLRFYSGSGAIDFHLAPDFSPQNFKPFLLPQQIEIQTGKPKPLHHASWSNQVKRCPTTGAVFWGRKWPSPLRPFATTNIVPFGEDCTW